ncbi:NARF domain-containing protein [Gelidibacter japonicus]|uniref:NARF domain-containing protein n=1 Tax=Gelidibacter japonicus TaxID=1962232 RepID=UPI003A920505
MKNNLLPLTILICSIFTISSTFGQVDSLRFKELETKVQLMEDYKSNIDQYSKVELEKHKAELKKSFDENYENVRNLFALILIIGIPSTLYGIYVMFWGVNKKIKKAIEEKIEKIVELKREDIIKLINNQVFDRRIKETKKILIISETEDAQEDIRSTMSNMGFKNLIYRLTNSTTIWPENDLIVINNIDGEFSQDKINQIIEDNEDEDTCFVAYTSKQIDRNPRMNFANSKYTLYHSILTTLAFITSIKEK